MPLTSPNPPFFTLPKVMKWKDYVCIHVFYKMHLCLYFSHCFCEGSEWYIMFFHCFLFVTFWSKCGEILVRTWTKTIFFGFPTIENPHPPFFIPSRGGFSCFYPSKHVFHVHFCPKTTKNHPLLPRFLWEKGKNKWIIQKIHK